jgi:hypothetical protein
MGYLNREHARKIAEKLKAETETGRGGHELVKVYYKGIRVAQFGIRYGSNKDQGHDHIPKGIHLSPRESLLLARCPMSYEDWILRMKEKGIVPTEDEGKDLPV